MYPGLFVYFKKHFSTFYQFLYSDKDNHYYLHLPSILTSGLTHTRLGLFLPAFFQRMFERCVHYRKFHMTFGQPYRPTPFRLIFQKIAIFSGNDEF